MKHRFRNTPLFLVLSCVSATCGSPLTGPISPSEWGGEHIGLVVAENGAAIEYDCARGTIDQPLIVADGRFTAAGTHTRGHGGPVRIDEVPDRHAAQYDGRIDGDTMILDVTLTDSGERLGRYTLLRGRSPRVFKCL